MNDHISPARSVLRVLVVARHPVGRAGLRGVVAEGVDLMVVGQAASADEAGRLALEVSPDVVLVAWEAGDLDEVVELVETLEGQHIPLVLLGDAPCSGELTALLRAGLHGFLLSNVAPDDLATALHAATADLLVLDPLLGRGVLAIAPATDALTEEALSEREREVLQLLALGLPNKTIAARLGISEHTVKFHVGSIMGKLGAASRTEAVTRAARRGLLSL